MIAKNLNIVDWYECIGEGGKYEIVEFARSAGTLKHTQEDLVVYRNEAGDVFVRTSDDFCARMQLYPE